MNSLSLSSSCEARRVETSRRKWRNGGRLRIGVPHAGLVARTLAANVPCFAALFLAATVFHGSAFAQFLGFDLPRPGRALSKAPPPNETFTPHPSIVRVTVDERTSLSHGTGVLVGVQDQYGLVVTNWHVVRDVAGPINVIFPTGFSSPARIVKVDKDWDLAALGIWNPNVAPLPIARTPPRVGDSLTIAGYGSGQYRAVTGRCNQFLSPGERFPYEMIEVSVEARRGDSGGPILNQRGEVAGILFGASTGTTSGSHSGRVRRFLTPWLAVVDRPPGAVASNAAPPASLDVPPTTTGAFAPTNSMPGTTRTGDTVAYDSGASLLAPQPGLGPPAQPSIGPAAPFTATAAGGWTPQASGDPQGVFGAPTGAPAGGATPFGTPASAGQYVPITPYDVVGRSDGSGAGLAPVPIAGSSLNTAATAERAAALERANGNNRTGAGAAHGLTDAPKPKRDEATPLDHLKNVLAIVGVLAVVFHLFRRSPAAAAAEDEDEDD